MVIILPILPLDDVAPVFIYKAFLSILIAWVQQSVYLGTAQCEIVISAIYMVLQARFARTKGRPECSIFFQGLGVSTCTQ